MPRDPAHGREPQLAGGAAHGQVRARVRRADRGARRPCSTTAGRRSRARRRGNPTYVRPSVLVIYREDHEFLLDDVIPRPARPAQRLRLRPRLAAVARADVGAEFKAQKVLAPLARSLAPGGRLLAIQSYGERSRRSRSSSSCGPDENPFQVDRHELLAALRARAGPRRRRVRPHGAPDDEVALPLRDAHAAVGDRRPHRHVDAVRRLERGHLREPDRGRAPRRGRPGRPRTSTPRRRCCRSTAGSGSTTRRSSSRVGAGSARAQPNVHNRLDVVRVRWHPPVA